MRSFFVYSRLKIVEVRESALLGMCTSVVDDVDGVLRCVIYFG